MINLKWRLKQKSDLFGRWYDLDQDITPDVYISDADAFYDREKLTDIINDIK